MKKVLSMVLCVALCLSFAACGGKKTVESYINGIQDEIAQMEEQVKQQGMNLKVSARENTLVYTYQYTIDLGDASDQVAAGLEQSMDSLKSVFDGILQTLKKEIPSAESVVVEYLDKDGKVLYSHEYK